MSVSPPERAGEEPLRVSPRRYSALRRGLFRTVEASAARLGGRRWYKRRFLSPGRFRVRREQLLVPGLPAGLAGAVIAQFSDLHAGSFLGDGDLEHVMAAAAEARPQAAVITGDLIVRDWREALTVLDDLATLEVEWGWFGVFGNHDYRGRQEHLIAQAYATRGIRFLRNANERIDTGAGVLAFTGVEDLEESKRIDAVAARAGLQPSDVEIALCHNPAGGPLLARPGCAAVLSGHTHGNQIDLPGFDRFGPPHPGARRDIVHAPDSTGSPGSNREARRTTALITSLGLGVVGVPLRVRAPAELVLLELVREDGEAPRAR